MDPKNTEQFTENLDIMKLSEIEMKLDQMIYSGTYDTGEVNIICKDTVVCVNDVQQLTSVLCTNLLTKTTTKRNMNRLIMLTNNKARKAKRISENYK